MVVKLTKYIRFMGGGKAGQLIESNVELTFRNEYPSLVGEPKPCSMESLI